VDLSLEGVWIVATGPLTADALTCSIQKFTGEESLSYYDAAAPIVDYETIDHSVVFRASRYDKGGDDAYLNCPMDRDTYNAFWQAMVNAETHEGEEFEKRRFFEGCLPVEEM